MTILCIESVQQPIQPPNNYHINQNAGPINSHYSQQQSGGNGMDPLSSIANNGVPPPTRQQTDFTNAAAGMGHQQYTVKNNENKMASNRFSGVFTLYNFALPRI